MAAIERLLDRIIVRAEVLGGKPCIRGSRVTVESVLERLASGASPSEILADHPGLERDDVFACAAYARAIIAGAGGPAAAIEAAEHGPPAVPKASSTRMSLRELAARPPAEIDRVVRAAGIVMDAEEIEAWDGTAGDGLDE
ncbi:MAG: DUF433 domain-containing protein [Chloroflexi bacterium]|nr:DUF433 domain-containing protein [Chloroflexota bacterium]